MNTLEKLKYVESLRNYYYKSKGHVPPAILDKLAPEIKEILLHEAKDVPKDREQIIRSHVLNLIGQFLGTVAYSVLAIYTLKEVIEVSVDFSFRNVLLLSILIFTYKAKFRLTH